MVNDYQRKIYIVIVAAGSGHRFGSDIPKQFLPLCGKPVVMHAIEDFRHIFPQAGIVLVLSRDMQDFWRELCRKYHFISPVIAQGGATRPHSVAAALSKIAAEGIGAKDVVMVHDGARPIVNADVCRHIMHMLDSGEARAVVPATMPTDSMVKIHSDGTCSSVVRSEYRCVQTPQAFDAALLIDAYKLAAANDYDHMTDEASVIAAYSNVDVKLVEGDAKNIKITRPFDIEIARLLLEND